MSSTMDAIIISKFGGPHVLQHQIVPKPTPLPGEVLIHVQAFGLNQAEMHMRKGEWDEWNPITGLECVGIVEACPGGEVPVGSKVVGVMGGMGRNRPGGYGQFVSVPAGNVVQVQTELSWEELAAVPEVYSTAYSSVKLAVDAGANVTATTRRKERFEMMKEMGAVDVVIEQEDLNKEFAPDTKFDKVLNLIGNSVLLESIRLVKTGGRMLQAGWLGGLAPLTDFNPMIQMESGVHFSLFHSKVLGTPGFPMPGIPLHDIVTKIENGAWDAKLAHVFEAKDIQKAHEMLDSHDAGGKIVVVRR